MSDSEEKKDLYCSLASNSISFGPHGGSRPCCAVNTYFWTEHKHVMPDYKNDLIKWFNNEDMVNLRQDLLDGKWNPVCHFCKIREENGQQSTRQIFNDTLSHLEEAAGRSYRTNTAEITDLNNISLLDITVGNKCNSACIMCNESASSLLAKELQDIGYQDLRFHKNLNWFSEEVIPDLVDNLPNLHAIQFAGGEPTINDAQFFLLKRLIEQGRSKNITLGYVTNLTSISDELFELWDQFDIKFITVSIDGIGPVNEYQRYPFTWKKVTEQWERIKKIAMEKKDFRLNLSHTITSMNIMTLPSVIKWWEAQIVEMNQGEIPFIIKSLPHMLCVNQPQRLDPVYIPKQMKEDVRKVLSNFERTLEEPTLSKYKPIFENIRNNVLNVEIDEQTQRTVWAQMKQYLTALDRNRNRKIFDYLPYMEKYW